MRKKGQSLIFEQMILFSIGVTIFVICFAVFNIYQNYFVSLSLHDQLAQMKGWISSHIIRLVQHEDTDSSIILEIPKRIGGEEYNITLDNSGIHVISLYSEVTKESSLYGISNKYILSGYIRSTERRFIIYKKGNEIIIS